MSTSRVALTGFVLLGLLGPVPSHGTPASGDLHLRCTQGCEPAAGDASTAPLRPTPGAHSLVLRWEGHGPPPPAVMLYAGDPEASDPLAERGPLTPRATPDGWWLEASIPRADLGEGRFVTALVEPERGFLGSRGSILHWRSWAVLTEDRLESQGRTTLSATAWGLNVAPVGLRLSGAGGRLPRGLGMEAPPFYALAQRRGIWEDVDLDGRANGSPGLSIHLSAPFFAPPGEGAEALADWGLDVEEEVRFEPAQGYGQSAATESAPWATLTELGIRDAYVVLTLNTSADALPLSEASLDRGRRGRLRFAHETAAQQDERPRGRGSLPHPRLWTSYDRRVLSADPALLDRVRAQLEAGVGVPGLPPTLSGTGDGGPTLYEVALEVMLGDAAGRTGDRGQALGGILSAEIVSERRGYGRPRSNDAALPSPLRALWAALLKGGAPEEGAAESAFPKGIYYAPAEAHPGSLSGLLPLDLAPPRFAQRGSEAQLDERILSGDGQMRATHRLGSAAGASASALSSSARVVVGARLRAGALVEGSLGGRAQRIVPIDAYAQYLIRVTVGVARDSPLLLPAAPALPGAPNLDVQPLQPGGGEGSKARIPGRRSASLGRALLLLVLLAVMGLSLLFPGPRAFINALFTRLAQVVAPGEAAPEPGKGTGDGTARREADPEEDTPPNPGVP